MAREEDTMPTARLNGIAIDYEDGGRGPAVLLTHGYSATGRMWAPQRPALEPRYRLITWDMRRHGRTDDPDDPAQYSEPLTVGDIRGLPWNSVRQCRRGPRGPGPVAHGAQGGLSSTGRPGRLRRRPRIS
jgi:hypothetical protein